MLAEPTLGALGAIVALTAAVGVASSLVASVFVFLPERLRTAVVPHLVSFATGALLGAALLGLLPSAINGAGLWNAHKLGFALLAGLLFFFVLEKLVLWRHCHEAPCEAHGANGAGHVGDAQRTRASGAMILWSDGAHNFLDGVVIGAAYLVNPALGVATAIAVFAHELPTEIGDVGVLLHAGASRLRALALNALVGLAAVAGGVLAFHALGTALRWLPYALAFAAASLLYVAVADLIPGLHRRSDLRSSAVQLLLIALGLATIWWTQPPPFPAAGMPRAF